jgi:3' terminal RNA ribose 2'-O-methyltransferase Hen1
MLLSISTTHRPATDLGYLLHKVPGRLHSFTLNFGTAHVFYPEASDERCTASLLVEVDPVGLVRRPKGAGEAGLIRQYVNDRPYVASSMLSTAISRVYGTAMGGRSSARPDLASVSIPLQVHVPAVPCPGDGSLLRELFEPLGYTVEAEPLALDPAFPEWGDSAYFGLRLAGETRVQDLLGHLYVLLPVLDGEKHYWVDQAEIDKLLRKGAGWLETHPRQETIVQRYLRRQQRFVRLALERLIESEGSRPVEEEEEGPGDPVAEDVIERPLSLNEQRHGTVIAVLKAAGARRIVDLGCGEGRLLTRLARDPAFEQVLGMDVTHRHVMTALEALRKLPTAMRRRADVIQGSLLYSDSRLAGWDAATVVEVIEHLEPGRLPAFERNVFEFARPGHVVVTTPNVEYNPRFEGLPRGAVRHPDHRFEWTRAEFRAWSERVGQAFGYSTRHLPIGPEDPEAGPPTQMAVFERWN